MSLPLGFVPPCLPTKAPRPPTGDAWLNEIKHDGFRVVARKDGERVRLYSRPPPTTLPTGSRLIVEARSRSCIIDGEAVCCDDNGVPSFDRIRYRRHLLRPQLQIYPAIFRIMADFISWRSFNS